MDVTIDYEDVVARFNNSLLTNLRGHGAEQACLEGWVPDEDPVMSILNMVEAAEAAGLASIAVHFGPATMDAGQRDRLTGLVSDLGRADLAERGDDGFVLAVHGLGEA